MKERGLNTGLEGLLAIIGTYDIKIVVEDNGSDIRLSADIPKEEFALLMAHLFTDHTHLIKEVAELEPLNKEELNLLTFLNSTISNHGLAPTIEEMRKTLGLSSKSTVHERLVNLEAKGWINKIPNKGRSITVTIPAKLYLLGLGSDSEE